MAKFIVFNILFGTFFLVFGLLFLLSPQVIIKLNKWGNKVVFPNESAINYRRPIGIFLIVAAIAIFFLSFLW